MKKREPRPSKSSIGRLSVLLEEAERAFVRRFGDSVETSRRVPFVTGTGLLFRKSIFVVERANGMRSALHTMPLTYRTNTPAYLDKLWRACERTEKDNKKDVAAAIKKAELFVTAKRPKDEKSEAKRIEGAR